MESFESFWEHTTEAAQRRIQADRETLPLFCAGFDSDTSSNDESDSKPKTIFDLRMLF